MIDAHRKDRGASLRQEAILVTVFSDAFFFGRNWDCRSSHTAAYSERGLRADGDLSMKKEVPGGHLLKEPY